MPRIHQPRLPLDQVITGGDQIGGDVQHFHEVIPRADGDDPQGAGYLAPRLHEHAVGYLVHHPVPPDGHENLVALCQRLAGQVRGLGRPRCEGHVELDPQALQGVPDDGQRLLSGPAPRRGVHDELVTSHL